MTSQPNHLQDNGAGTSTTRQAHLDWCKRRAIECLASGDVPGAYASMVSGLKQHPETQGHARIELGIMQIVAGHLSSPQEMRRFIEGFK